MTTAEGEPLARFGVYDGPTGHLDALTAEAHRVAVWDVDGRYSTPVGGPVVDEVAAYLGARFGATFTTVIMQGYAHGGAVTPWHDDRTMSGDSCILSIGAPRTFGIRPHGGEPVGVTQSHGSLIWMAGRFHRCYEHRIMPDIPMVGAKFSFVFRTPLPADN